MSWDLWITGALQSLWIVAVIIHRVAESPILTEPIVCCRFLRLISMTLMRRIHDVMRSFFAKICPKKARNDHIT